MHGLKGLAMACFAVALSPSATAGTIVVSHAGASSITTCTLAQAIDAANRANNGSGSYGATPAGATTIDPLSYSVVRGIGSGTCTGATGGANTISLENFAGQTIVFEATAAMYPNQGWNDTVEDRADNYWYGPNGLPPIASTILIEGHGATLKIADGTRRLRFFFVGADPSLAAVNETAEPVTPGFNTPGPGNLTLRQLTLSGGRQMGGLGSLASGAGAGMGGAIFNQGTLSIEACVLVDNAAEGGRGVNIAVIGGGGMGADGKHSDSSGGGMGGRVPLGTGDAAVGDPTSIEGAHAGGNDSGLAGAGTYKDLNVTPYVVTPLRAGNGGGSGNVESYMGHAFGMGGAGGGFRGAAGLIAWTPGYPGPGGDFGQGGVGSAHNGGDGGGGVGGGAGYVFSPTGSGGGFGGGGAPTTTVDDNAAAPCLGCGMSGFGGGGTYNLGALGKGYGGGTTGAGMGGGVFNFAGRLQVTNSTLTANTALGGKGQSTDGPADKPGYGAGLGGAVFNLNGSVYIDFSTLNANRVEGGDAADGGALYSVSYNADAGDDATALGYSGSHFVSVQLRQSILAGSVRRDDGSPVNDLVVDRPDTVDNGDVNRSFSMLQLEAAKNLVTRRRLSGNVAGDLAPGDTITSDPKLSALMNNGGPTLTMIPLEASPARDAAPLASCTGMTDQRGEGRPMGSGCDLGAVEIDQPIVVTTNIDETVNNGLCSLREAIDNANGAAHPDCGGGNSVFNVVRFAPGVSAIAQTGGVMGVYANITIDGDRDGDGVPDVVLDALHATPNFVLGSNKRTNFNGLELRNGNGGSQAGGALRIGGSGNVVTIDHSIISEAQTTSQGGAIDVPFDNQFSVRNSTFQNNSAGGNGGAIMSYGFVDIDTSKFIGNHGANGGGLFNGVAMTIARSTFRGNTASGSGGGIRNEGFLDVIASTLSGNAASSTGGGLSNTVSVTIGNSTLSGNTATTSGGGISNENVAGSVADLRQVTLADNQSPSGAGFSNSKALSLSRSIVVGAGPNCAGAYTDGGGNLAWGDLTCGAMPRANPLLQPLADNGGPTATRLPGAGSAAIDELDCIGNVNADQRATSRPQGLLCDVGAVETQTIYSVGGTVQGLAGAGLTLSLNNAETVSVAADGAFTFALMMPRQAPYQVVVQSSPVEPSQTCVLANDSGTIGAVNVSNVQVTCTTNSYAIGGTVSGLVGSGLVLSLNDGAQTQSIAGNGAFAFDTPLASGGTYAVTVATQPTQPAQICVVGGGSGPVAAADVTSIVVDCSFDMIFADGFDG